jgi:hypothetical protein
MSTTYNPTHTLIPIWGRTFFRITIHITNPMCLAIGYCHLCHILHMFMGISVMMFKLEKNHGRHEFIFIDPMKPTLKQQPTFNMGPTKKT